MNKTKFAQWLDENRGMATRLAQELGVGRASITNVKSMRNRMPPEWMPVIEKLSRRRLNIATLLTENGLIKRSA